MFYSLIKRTLAQLRLLVIAFTDVFEKLLFSANSNSANAKFQQRNIDNGRDRNVRSLLGHTVEQLEPRILLTANWNIDLPDGTVTLRRAQDKLQLVQGETLFDEAVIAGLTSITINGSSNDNTINIQSLGSLDASLTIDGKQGHDAINVSGDIHLQGHDLNFTAETIDMPANLSIVTRKLAEAYNPASPTAFSTGDSGDITFTSNHVTLTDTTLLADITTDNTATTYEAGDISISTSDYLDSTAPGFVYIESNTSTGITLTNVDFRGKLINLISVADSKHAFNEETGDASTRTLDGISLFGAHASSEAISNISITTDNEKETLIKGQEVTISSKAVSSAVVNAISIYVGVAAAKSDPQSMITISGDGQASIIATGGNLSLDNSAEGIVNAAAKSLPTPSGSLALTVAVGDSSAKSITQTGPNVQLTAENDIRINSELKRDISINSTSMVGEAGNISPAIGLTRTDTSVISEIAGSATSGGSIEITAESSTSTNRTIATAGVGGLVSSIATKITGAPGALKSAITGKASNKSSGSKTKTVGSLGFGGALAISNQTETVQARTKEDAKLAALAGNVNIKSKLNSVPKLQTTGTIDMNKVDGDTNSDARKHSLALAINVGDITNHSVAEVGNRSRIDAAGTISVIADITQSYNEKNIFAEVISQRTEWDWDFEAGRITSDDDLFLDALNPNLGVANSFFTSWAQSSSKGTTNNAAGSFNFLFQENDMKIIVL